MNGVKKKDFKTANAINSTKVLITFLIEICDNL